MNLFKSRTSIFPLLLLLVYTLIRFCFIWYKWYLCIFLTIFNFFSRVLTLADTGEGGGRSSTPLFISYPVELYFVLIKLIFARSGQCRGSWDMTLLWKRGVIFRELVTHTKNHLFAFWWNIATYLTLIVFC